MILVTRLNGPPFAVNPDLLERVESTPDTILTLIDGTKYLVAESVQEVVALVRDYRASVIASARDLAPAEHPLDDVEFDAPAALHPHLRSTSSSSERPHLAAVPSPHQEV